MDSEVKVGYVYWIHRPEHTDIFTQGYVGITSKTVEIRYKQHIAASTPNGNSLPINKAIRKYGESLVVDTIVIGSIEYCAEIENKLRPHSWIGYNVHPGGAYLPLVTRLSYSPPEDTRLKQSLAKLGKKLSEDTKLKMSVARKNVPSWCNSKADKSLWLKADEIHKIMCDNHNIRRCDLSELVNLSGAQLKSIFNKIKSGWNPTEDPQWVKFHSENS
jgi:hypothetical protein